MQSNGILVISYRSTPMYSKKSTAILTSLAMVTVAMLFATRPLVADHAFAHYYHHHSHHHYYHHHHHHHSHHHYYHH
jgi:hypothetical protein